VPRIFLDRTRIRALLVRHRLLLLLLALDVAAKVAAFQLLPNGRPVAVLPGLRLYLAINEWGVMGGVEGIGKVTANSAYTMLLAFGLLVFAFAVHRLGASALALGWRVAAGVGVFFGVAFAAQTLALPLAHVKLPPDMIVATIRIAVLAVTLSLYSASRALLPRAAFTLLAAGALGNGASYFYPPYQVVDFLMVPLEPFAPLLGRSAQPGGGNAVGVINLADIYLFTFPLLLLAWPLCALLRRLRG
jgi:lipoprotein signal peptidase